jgi:hypothetical protein
MSTSQYYIVGNNVSDTSRTRSSVGAVHSQHVVDYFALMRRDDREMIFTGSGADNHWPAHVSYGLLGIEQPAAEREIVAALAVGELLAGLGVGIAAVDRHSWLVGDRTRSKLRGSDDENRQR